MSERFKIKYIKLFLTLTLAVLISQTFLSCKVEEIQPLSSVDEYVARYNNLAKTLGFSRITLSESEGGVCGFAAFDRLFIVGLSCDTEGMIYSIEVSTGASYAQTLTDDEKFGEALIYAAAIISPILSDKPLSNDELSTLAGKILYSEQKQIKIAKDTENNKNSFAYCKMTKASNGGFEIIIKSTEN